jgi:hypothetical protein
MKITIEFDEMDRSMGLAGQTLAGRGYLKSISNRQPTMIDTSSQFGSHAEMMPYGPQELDLEITLTKFELSKEQVAALVEALALPRGRRIDMRGTDE